MWIQFTKQLSKPHKKKKTRVETRDKKDPENAAKQEN